jgi:hypothetical protein
MPDRLMQFCLGSQERSNTESLITITSTCDAIFGRHFCSKISESHIDFSVTETLLSVFAVGLFVSVSL